MFFLISMFFRLETDFSVRNWCFGQKICGRRKIDSNRKILQAEIHKIVLPVKTLFCDYKKQSLLTLLQISQHVKFGFYANLHLLEQIDTAERNLEYK